MSFLSCNKGRKSNLSNKGDDPEVLEGEQAPILLDYLVICSPRISFYLSGSLQRFPSIFHRFFDVSAIWRCVILMHHFMRNLSNCSGECQNYEGMFKYVTAPILESPKQTFLA